MSSTARKILLTPAMAREIPTASASMEVATAMMNMVFTDRSASGVSPSSSLLRASRSILMPMSASRAKAIQWSMAEIASMNSVPR